MSEDRAERHMRYRQPITDHTFLHVGMHVKTPDTDHGWVVQVNERTDHSVHVEWKGTRRAYSFAESQGFTILDRRWYRGHAWSTNGWPIVSSLTTFDHAVGTSKSHQAPGDPIRVAEVTSMGEHIRWLTASEIQAGKPRDEEA